MSWAYRSGNLQLPRENVIKGLLDRGFVTRLDRCVYERRSASFSDRTFHAPKPDARQSRSAPRPAKSNWSEPLRGSVNFLPELAHSANFESETIALFAQLLWGANPQFRGTKMLEREDAMYRNLGRMLVTGGVTAVMLVVVGALGAGMPRAEDGHFVQTNLVSDIPGLATITDPELLNPWGVSHSLTSPFWVSNQGTNTATLYAVTDETTVSKININAPAGFVKIPTTGAGPQGPTGQVNNTNTSSFPVNGGGDGKSAHFIFANLNGTISAWDTGPTAFIQVTTPGAVYTGLAINGAQTRLYAADDVPPGRIDVFDSSFALVSLAAGAFVDPSLPAGLVPFNVQNIG